MKKLALLAFALFTCTSTLIAQTSTDVSSLMQALSVNPELLNEKGITSDQIQKYMQLKSKYGATNPTAPVAPSANNTIVTNSMADSFGVKTFNSNISSFTGGSKEDSAFKKITLKNEVFGQDYFRNTTINIFNRANVSKAPESYILDAGDELNVSIWGFSELNEVYRIDEEGYIQPANVGRIYLKGLTYKDARDLVAKKFGTAYDLSNSKIAIKLNYSRVITVNIVGEVNFPGSYSIPAINTAFNAILAARGPNEIGSVRNISIRRGGKTIRTLDVYEFLLNPESNQDFYLQDNDYIIVPAHDKIVSAVGQVKRPASYELKKNETLSDLIRFCGGLKSEAFTKSIQITRFENNKRIYTDVNYEEVLKNKTTVNLNDGDVLLVNGINTQIINFASINGAVEVADNYEIESNSKIADLIKKAGGLSHNAYTKTAYLIRIQDDLSRSYYQFNVDSVLRFPTIPSNMVLRPFDHIEIFTKDRFTDSIFIRISGSVRIPGVYIFGEKMSLKDLLYFAGGLKTEAANNRIEVSRIMNYNPATNTNEPTKVIIKTIQINPDLTIDQASSAFLLQPYDEVYVRKAPDFEYQKNVTISGEVKYPGLYSMANKNEKVLDLIQRAGGLTTYAFVMGAKLKRYDEKLGFVILDLKKAMEQPESKFNYILKPGDEIIIPKINELISVSGAIRFSGIDSLHQVNTPYFAGRRAGYYINNFVGGFEKNAWKRKTLVFEANGRIRKTHSLLLFNIYPKVKLGSRIVVPVKEPKAPKEPGNRVDWNQSIENFTIKATGVLTLYLIIKNIRRIN